LHNVYEHPFFLYLLLLQVSQVSQIFTNSFLCNYQYIYQNILSNIQKAKENLQISFDINYQIMFRKDDKKELEKEKLKLAKETNI